MQLLEWSACKLSWGQYLNSTINDAFAFFKHIKVREVVKRRRAKYTDQLMLHVSVVTRF